MGLNLDLCAMFGAPTELTCPRCHATVRTDFEDYDIECGHPNPSPGEWHLRMYCQHCDNEWTWNAKVWAAVQTEGNATISGELKQVDQKTPLLILARSVVRDLAFGWRLQELVMSPRKLCELISKELGDTYDFDTGDVVEETEEKL